MKCIDEGNREINIELLRIIAMFMVIMLYALKYGGILALYDFGIVGYIFLWFIEIICYVAVNVFILITGYFMVNLPMKLSRIIKLIFQVEFYSILCLAIARLTFHVNVLNKDFIL